MKTKKKSGEEVSINILSTDIEDDNGRMLSSLPFMQIPSKFPNGKLRRHLMDEVPRSSASHLRRW